MGRATLFALAAAAVLAAAPEPGGGKMDALVEAGRTRQAALAPLFDEVEALRRSYAWERDDSRARTRRTEVRDRLGPELEALDASAVAVEAEFRRFASEHGIETLSLMASGLGDAPPEVRSAMRGQTFMHQARTAVTTGRDLLRAEEREWQVFSSMAAERRFHRRLVAGLVIFLLLLLAFAARLMLVLRRRNNERIPEIVDRKRLS